MPARRGGDARHRGGPALQTPSVGCGAQMHERGAPENPRFQPRWGPGRGQRAPVWVRGSRPCVLQPGLRRGAMCRAAEAPPSPGQKQAAPSLSRAPAGLRGSLADSGPVGAAGLVPALPAVGSRWGGVFLARARPTPLFPVPGTPGSSLLARLMRRLAPTYFGFILPFPSFSTWTYLTGFISNFTLSAVFLLLCRGRSVF